METTKGDLRPIEDNKKYVMPCRAVVSLERDVDGCGLAAWEGGSFDDKMIDWIAGKSPSCGLQVLAPHSSSRTNPVQLTHAWYLHLASQGPR
ncbi:hypothetical protein GB937_001710 [Aspergillus fischeri]|nr:hypothetical protein GB937_001710 [Aspergillus fischeri]